MWQISWIISIIPDSLFIWITYLLFGLGVVLYIASKLVRLIPLMGQYKLPAEIVGVVLLVVGAYLYGSHGTEMLWRERVKDLEAKVAEAEEKSKQTNVEIREKIVTKIKEVVVNRDIIRDRIVEKEKIIDAECRVAPEAIDILNAAATNKVGDKK